MYRNMHYWYQNKWYYGSIIHQTNRKSHRQTDQIFGYQNWSWEGGELDEGSKKVENSNYKINKYLGCNM